MKAIICSKYGSPEVLKLVDIKKPVPKDNEVLIKVRASSVTVADVRIRSFSVPPSFWIPARIALGLLKPKNQVPGVELSGEIETLGKDVIRFKKGDQIYGVSNNNFGAYAEYICMPENGIIAIKPTNLSFEEAAVMPVGARTAWHYLEKVRVQSGQKILIYGASGSVGTYAVQLAKYLGAEVTGVCSGTNEALVKSLGAHEIIDYTKEDFGSRKGYYDFVLVAVDKCSFSSCLKALKKDGTYMNVTTPIPTLHMIWAMITSRIKVISGELASKNPESLNKLRDLIEKGEIKSVIDRSYTLEKIVEAHNYVDQGHKKGNVVVKVSS